MSSLSCIVVAGGVAANATVRESLSAVASDAGLPLVTPPREVVHGQRRDGGVGGCRTSRAGTRGGTPRPWLGGDGDGKDGGERREVPLLPRWPLGQGRARHRRDEELEEEEDGGAADARGGRGE